VILKDAIAGKVRAIAAIAPMMGRAFVK